MIKSRFNCFNCLNSVGTRTYGHSGTLWEPPELQECVCESTAITDIEHDHIAENGYEAKSCARYIAE